MAKQWHERPLGYYLGPGAENIFLNWAKDTPIRDIPGQVIRGLLEVSPAADMRDTYEGAKGISRGILALDPREAVQGAGLMGMGLLGTMTGGVGDNVARGGASTADDGIEYLRSVLKRLKEENPHRNLSLRVFDGEGLTPGSKLRPSRVWVNGDPTDELLPGVSAVEIGEDLDQALRRASIYLGDQIGLVDGDVVGVGEDMGELILKNAELLDVLPYQYGGYGKLGKIGPPKR